VRASAERARDILPHGRIRPQPYQFWSKNDPSSGPLSALKCLSISHIASSSPPHCPRSRSCSSRVLYRTKIQGSCCLFTNTTTTSSALLPRQCLSSVVHAFGPVSPTQSDPTTHRRCPGTYSGARLIAARFLSPSALIHPYRTRPLSGRRGSSTVEQ